MENGTSAKMLYNNNALTKKYVALDQQMNRVSMLIPIKEFPFDAGCHIYGEKVAFYSYQGQEIFGVIIEDPFIRQSQFSVLKLAWNYARTLPENENYRDLTLI